MDFTEAYPDTCSSVGIAARLGNLSAIKTLLKEGKTADVRDNRGWTSTHEAAYAGHYQCLYYLLRTGIVDPDWTTFEQETALLLAARSGNTDCVRVLLKYCANPNITTEEGFSPLYIAARKANYACVKLLLESPRIQEYISKKNESDEGDGMEGAVNHSAYNGVTSLHAAAECGANDVVQLLLKYGAKINKVGDFCLTPVFYAAQFGHADCLKTLLEVAKERDELFIVDAAAHDNATPLLIAAQNGHAACIKLLLQYGADPNIAIDTPPLTPLQFALQFEHEDAFRLLVKVTENSFPADVNHPLAIAVQNPVNFLQVLIDNGYNIHQHFNTRGHSLQSQKYYSDCVSLLCMTPKIDAANVLIEAGLSPRQQRQTDLPPLAAALEHDDLELCDLYLKSGANLNMSHKSFCGNVTLDFATLAERHDEPSLGQTFQFILRRKDLEIQSCFNCSLSGEHRAHQFEQQDGVIVGKCDLIKSRQLCPGSALATLLHFCVNLPELDEDYLSDASWWSEQKDYLKKIQVTTNTLMHTCRVKVVREMLHCGTYSTSGINRLGLPVCVKEYLTFIETLGPSFIQAYNTSNRN